MSELNEIMARRYAQNGGGKIIPGYTPGKVSPYLEWLKWLSYEPNFEKERIESLNTKKVLELTLDELDYVRTNRRNKILAGLFKIYGTAECTEEQYMTVYNCMRTESIEKLMLSKLTDEEIEYAKSEVARLSSVSQEELSKKVTEEQRPENYESLPMIDAYILHIISGAVFASRMENVNLEISAQRARNDATAQKSLHFASNPYENKGLTRN